MRGKLLESTMNCAGWTSSLFKKQDSLNLTSLGKEIIEGTETLLKLQLQTSAGLVSLISAYAPTLISASEFKDRFYDDLSAVISKVPPHWYQLVGVMRLV